MTDRIEDELRNEFEALRAADAGSAPSFDGMWQRAVAGADAAPKPGRLRWPILAAAAAIAVAAGLSVARFAGNEAALPSAETITTWRAPTDVLLRYPGSEIPGAPNLRGSSLDRFIPESKLLKGDR